MTHSIDVPVPEVHRKKLREVAELIEEALHKAGLNGAEFSLMLSLPFEDGRVLVTMGTMSRTDAVQMMREQIKVYDQEKSAGHA